MTVINLQQRTLDTGSADGAPAVVLQPGTNVLDDTQTATFNACAQVPSWLARGWIAIPCSP